MSVGFSAWRSQWTGWARTSAVGGAPAAYPFSREVVVGAWGAPARAQLEQRRGSTENSRQALNGVLVGSCP
jgi:hypothetical protein